MTSLEESTKQEFCFQASVACLLSPPLKTFERRLSRLSGLYPGECEIILRALRESLIAVLHGRLTRVLLVELHIARDEGRLKGEDSAQRWAYFIALSSRRSFWDGLGKHYPSLATHITAVITRGCAAAMDFASHWASDRARLGGLLCGQDPGCLLTLRFGVGDSHRGGRTVALIRCEAGQLVYKPRALSVDRALASFIENLAPHHSEPITLGVPHAVTCNDHGWSEFIEHRHATDENELRAFYRGIGQWLIILRLLGGNDVHAENLIARGGCPFLIDCETLFTPNFPRPPSNYSKATDHASELMSDTVLRIGLLPHRFRSAGLYGADMSALGALPDQQPPRSDLVVMKAGTDEAYLGSIQIPSTALNNLPSPQPALSRYWPEMLDAFEQMHATLCRLDAAGDLRARLNVFNGCSIRAVLRNTSDYAELSRMLWHPVSLHDEVKAQARVRDLLTRMANNTARAPSEPSIVNAEITDLLAGDIPYFSMTTTDGRLQGPNGTQWLPAMNLLDEAIKRWRVIDLPLERGLIQMSLASAYTNDERSGRPSLWPTQAHDGDVDVRRRVQLSGIMREFVRTAIHGEDGTVNWIAPGFVPRTGWSVGSLSQDLYSGLMGVALLFAAYMREAQASHVEPVESLSDLLKSTVKTLRLMEATTAQQRQNTTFRLPPLPLGGYTGLGGSIWAWLRLHALHADEGIGIVQACALANMIPDAIPDTVVPDVLSGLAGAISPLLDLAHKTQDNTYLDIACTLGDQLCRNVVFDGNKAFWQDERFPRALGGFSHGATGMAWALMKLSRAAAKSHYAEIAQAAFAFEESLFDAEMQDWLDLRHKQDLPKISAAAWCNGSVGIGLAHLDLDPALTMPFTRKQLKRAVAASWPKALGWDHCACHGDASALELLHAAIALGEGPDKLTQTDLLAHWLTSLEIHGLSCKVGFGSFSPGLMAGAGGVAYQLLRAHPNSQLPSILTLGT